MTAFKEREHPRDEAGRFRRKAGSTAVASLAEAFTSAEQNLFRTVAGHSMPDDPQQARELLHNGDFMDADQDALIALDDKLIEAVTPEGAFEKNGLEREKFLGKFDSLYEASGFVNEGQREFRDSLTTQERSALKAYKGGKYDEINGPLRRARGNLDSLPDDVRQYVEALDSAFEKAPRTTEPISLFRRGMPPEATRAFGNYEEAGLLGQTFGDDAYESTTVNKDWTGGGVGGRGELHLVIPAGTPVIQMDTFLHIKGASEYEVLLPRGVRYHITRAERSDRNKEIIEVEVLPYD
jgi:hypothetical protein